MRPRRVLDRHISAARFRRTTGNQIGSVCDAWTPTERPSCPTIRSLSGPRPAVRKATTIITVPRMPRLPVRAPESRKRSETREATGQVAEGLSAKSELPKTGRLHTSTATKPSHHPQTHEPIHCTTALPVRPRSHPEARQIQHLPSLASVNTRSGGSCFISNERAHRPPPEPGSGSESRSR